MIENKQVYQTFDNMRFPLALCVVYEHMFTKYGPVINGNAFNPNEFGSFIITNKLLNCLFAEPFAVPLFMLISGYLFFRSGHLTKKDFLRKITSRIRTILVPYFIWNAIPLSIILLRSLLRGENNTLNISINNLLSCFWIYRGELNSNNLGINPSDYIAPINGPLWYLRDLFVLSLISPLLWICVKKIKLLFPVFLTCAWISCYYTTDIAVVRTSLMALCFFVWGGYLSDGKIFDLAVMRGWIMSFPFVILVLAIFLLPDMPSGMSVFFKNIKVFFLVPVALNIAFNLSTLGHTLNSKFSGASFFIYVSHAIIYPPITKIVLTLCNRYINNVTVVPIYVIMYLFTLLLLYGMYLLTLKLPQNMKTLILGRA